MRKLFLILLLSPVSALAVDYPTNAMTKEAHPARPEMGGLRLEIDATLDDSISSDGTNWEWGGAFLTIEVAVHNISSSPITVPTMAHDKKPAVHQWPSWGSGLERIIISIDSPKFKGKPTVYPESIFAPVVLLPDEHALLLRHNVMINDRKHADSIKEVLVSFNVSSSFVGPKGWWRGNLLTYGEIVRFSDPDKKIADQIAFNKQRDAERADKNFLKNLPARVAALIVASDRVAMRGEDESKLKETTLSDSDWIRRFGELLGQSSISKDTSCLCAGWLTAYFYKGGEMVISIAAIHGHQLRMHWKNGGGDFTIDAQHWDALSAELESAKQTAPAPKSS